MQVYNHYRDFPMDQWRWPNFSPQEMACRGTGKLAIDPRSMDMLQELRDLLGRPLIINSAYRSPEHNANVGGARASMHLRAQAFDVNMANHDPHVFEQAARAVGFKGIGRYPSARHNFIHIDTRTSPAQWGMNFPPSATTLPDVGAPDEQAPPVQNRDTIAQSTTMQASATQVVAGATSAVTAVAALSGPAQVIIAVAAAVSVLAALWVGRERLRRWAMGDR